MIEAVFADILTDFECLMLVKEITKFILYNKQQIPFTYDKMNIAVNHKKKQKKPAPRIMDNSQRLFHHAETIIDSLEEIFDKLNEEFSKGDNISEIALILGSSLIMPKQIYRIHVPSLEKGHSPMHHSCRASMAEILRLIVSSDKLHQMLSKPLAPTNLFILVRRAKSSYSNPWLVPKPRFNIPSVVQQFSFKLDGRTPELSSCSCKGFQIYSDVTNESPAIKGKVENTMPHDTTQMWYQAPVVLKGFKDIFIHGVSVSKRWLVANDDNVV